MAQTADQVIVELVARMDKYERDMRRAGNVSKQTFGGIERDAASMGRAIGRTAGLLVGGLGIRALEQMTSAWIDLNSRIELAAGSMERGGAVMERLQSIARRTYSSLDQTAESWLQNTTALRELGYSTQQQLDLTEALNNALVISGAKSQVAASVMDAWSKAMALGELRGENLNTVIQRGGRLAEALAKSMGVSTNELRRLGMEGKITTNEMFGVTSELETLRQEADNMPATVSDGLMRLRDAVWAFVGAADTAMGTNQRLGESFVNLANSIEGATDEPWFEKLFGTLGEFAAQELDNFGRDLQTLKGEIEEVSAAFDYVRNTPFLDIVTDAVDHLSGESMRRLQESIIEIETSFSNLITTMSIDAAAAGDPLAGELDKIWESLIRDRESAEDAKDAITRLIAQYPDSSGLLGELQRIADALSVVWGEAENAAVAISNLDVARSEQAHLRNRKPYIEIDLDDDGGPIVTPTRPSKGGGRKSPQEQFSDALEAQRLRTEMLREETALQATLNPLVEDYGYAMAKLRAQQELENAATKAGLALTPERIAQIEQLAEGYAMATAESARLAAAQGVLRQSFDDLESAGRQALDTIIDGFIEGKDAGEIFNSVLKDLAKNLINIGLNTLTGGMKAGGFNPLGWLFGFDRGGYTGDGGKYEPAGVVHRGEYVFSKEATQRAGVGNLEALHRSMRGYASGGYVGSFTPPQAPASRRDERAVIDISISVDESGNIVPLVRQVAGTEADIRVAQAAPAIVAASVGQASKAAPAAVANYQQQRAGSDYRTM